MNRGGPLSMASTSTWTHSWQSTPKAALKVSPFVPESWKPTRGYRMLTASAPEGRDAVVLEYDRPPEPRSSAARRQRSDSQCQFFSPPKQRPVPERTLPPSDSLSCRGFATGRPPRGTSGCNADHPADDPHSSLNTNWKSQSSFDGAERWADPADPPPGEASTGIRTMFVYGNTDPALARSIWGA